MTRLFFNSENCQGATSALTGKHYTAKDGFINVSDPRDAAYLKQGGYVEAGGMPHFSKYWYCEACDWEAALNHCRYCDSTDLVKVEV